MFQVAYNPTDQPVVVDQFGRTLGGREFGPVDADQPAVSEAVNTVGLRLYDEGSITDGQNPQAVEAARQAKSWNERVISVASLNPTKLEAETVPFQDSADPVGDLVRSEQIELPAVRPAKKDQVES